MARAPRDTFLQPDRRARRVPVTVALLVAAAVALSACGGSGEGFQAVIPNPTTVSASDAPDEVPETTAPVVTLPSSGGGGLGRPACELLTRDEVSSLVGNSVTASMASGDSECFWGVGVDGGTSVTLRVVANEVTTAGPECSVERGVLENRAASGAANAEGVSGVGDEAIWVWERVAILTQGTFLACWDDAVILVLLSGESSAAALRNVAQGVAETVRARL